MAKIIVDLNEHTINCAKCGQGIGWMSNAQLEEAIKNGVVISDNATNGDVIKALFPDIIVEYGYGLAIGVDFGVGGERDLSRDWWNAPYKAGDTNGNS